MAYLQLNRLVIIKQGKSVFDEKFHQGINIIRGENGVGKSTIANAIYYLLGGDFNKWLPEIERCDFVVGEIDLNGKIITVKREISRLSMQPMWIFFDNYEASEINSTSWVQYPYKRTNRGLSFSQLFFRALDYPEIETADDEFITFNQAFRLMYIDQISPLDELMKDIDFDSPLIRKTTADLLLGVYDNSLFNLQILVKNLKKNELEFEAELKLLKSVYSSIDEGTLEASITEAEERLIKIDTVLKDSEAITVTNLDTKANRIAHIQEEIGKLSEKLQLRLNDKSLFEFDKLDSQDFIDELSNQISALTESESIRSILGELKINYCPSCLQPTKETPAIGNCELCKEPINAKLAQAQIFRIRQQLSAQVQESQSLLNETESNLEAVSNDISILKSQLKIKQRQLNRLVADRSSDKNQVYEEMLVTKGQLIQQIANFQTELTTAKKYWSIYRSYQKVKTEIQRASQLIEEKKNSQRNNYQLALEQINRYAKELLTGDGSYEIAFMQAGLISLDFSKNTYALDNRNNFSASSSVILKNSIRFGIFFASLKLNTMRYPKFMLCDNIEDKGMNEARSHNFQKNLVQLASSDEFAGKQFQIIYTTSMVDESVDVPAYTVGEYYTPSSKALNISIESQQSNNSQDSKEEMEQ